MNGRITQKDEVRPVHIGASLTVGLPVLYRDDDLIAVAKPSGLFVHRSEKDRSQRTAALQVVRDQVGHDVYTIHRLDRATSGVLLFGLHPEAATAMSELFAQRAISKTYQCLLRGHCPSTGIIETPLVSARGRGLPSEHPFAVPQEAVTEFQRRVAFEIPIPSGRHSTTRCCLVDVFPKTGRYHQIRRHFNYIAHPVIGDSSHGDSRQNRVFREHAGVSRLMLAATGLKFRHPYGDVEVDLTCPPESSYEVVIRRLTEFSV